MKLKITYLLFSIVVVLLGFFLIFSPKISDSIAFNIGQPLFYGFLPILIYFLILLFFNLDRIKSQYKLFNYYLFGSIVLVFLTPIDCRAPLDLCINKQTSAIILSILFIFISLIYSLVQFLKKNNNNNQEKPEKNYFIK